MARIEWGKVGERYFEAGLDRGVFYPTVGDGVPWSGLVSINEGNDGGDTRPFYLDGFKVMNLSSASEFIATVEAYFAPAGFELCEGNLQVSPGLFATHQSRAPFSLAYRTKIGNDVEGTDAAYKIHIVYNALTAPGDRTRKTIDDSSDTEVLSWDITTLAPMVANIRPTAHFVINTKTTPDKQAALDAKVIELENILYGTASLSPRIPPVDELITLFAGP
jgi:hypothetical protein